MILYFSYAGRIKQRILCCRKFIIMFCSSNLFIKRTLQCLHLLSVGSLSLTSREYWSIFLRKRMLSFEFLLRLSAILKLDFLKSPGKSASARPPRGMKLGNGPLPAEVKFRENTDLWEVQICVCSSAWDLVGRCSVSIIPLSVSTYYQHWRSITYNRYLACSGRDPNQESCVNGSCNSPELAETL